jgi:phenylacetate-CoA ligase
VPFYRRRFTELGVTSQDIRTWQDVARLPILTKRNIAEHAEAMIAENFTRASLLTHHSGGSTGIPLRFYRDDSYLTASEAGTYRNLLQSGWRTGEMIAFFWGWNDKLAAMGRAEFFARQLARRMYQFDPFHSGEPDMATWWRTWRLIRPAVAHGYASTIARFARYLEDRALRPRPLRGVFTTAEKLFPLQRMLIERVFACRVFDCYGSSEVQNIATECAHGKMHINADFAVVELQDAEREPNGAAPLLVTSLKNYAMPFLRYRNEDTGSLVEGSCDCGNGFPLMSLDVARVSDNFKLPNGRVVHGEFFTHLMYGSAGVESFQFHQVSSDTIILRYVPATHGDPKAALAAAVSQIEALAPGQLHVGVEAVSEIPLSSAGKHRFTRSEVA